MTTVSVNDLKREEVSPLIVLADEWIKSVVPGSKVYVEVTPDITVAFKLVGGVMDLMEIEITKRHKVKEYYEFKSLAKERFYAVTADPKALLAAKSLWLIVKLSAMKVIEP